MQIHAHTHTIFDKTNIKRGGNPPPFFMWGIWGIMTMMKNGYSLYLLTNNSFVLLRESYDG
jgi:hypothetical protein